MASVLVRKRREVPEWKKRLVKELAELMRKYRVIGVADLTGMPTAQLQQIRKKFRKYAVFKVAKKRLILKALEEAGIDKSKFEPYLQGSTMLLFTDMNPFKLARMIESEKVPMAAKPGQVSDREIVIPEGDTGLQPGPILSTFGKLRIPYEIRRGTIYVKKDTVVAKPGDVISEELAGLLQNLGIMPFEVSLKILAMYDGGVIIPREQLLFDIEQVKEDFLEAAKEALGLAVEIVYPAVPEAVEAALAKAFLEARALAGEAGVLLPGLEEDIIAKAVQEELAVIAALGEKAKELGLEAPATPAKAEEAPAKEEKAEEGEEKEEEKEEEVDLGEGLSGLFGM